jgi:hypothetical protein
MPARTTVIRRHHGLPPRSLEEDYKNDCDLARALYTPITKTSINVMYYSKNREIYRGQIKDNMRHGEGQMIYKNGVIFEGIWENDKPKHVEIYTKRKSFRKLVAFLLADEYDIIKK